MRLTCLSLWLVVAYSADLTAAAYVPVAKRQVPQSHVLHERQPERRASTWTKREKADHGMVMPMRVGLKQTNLQDGHDRLMDISNPSSPNYGKYMSAEEVFEYFAPPPTRVGAVMDWLKTAGIDSSRLSLSTNKQWIQFDASVLEAENLLYTDFFLFEHSETAAEGIACEEYHIPGHLSEHIDYITPGIRLLRGTRQSLKKSRRADSESQGGGYRAFHTDVSALPNGLSIQASDGGMFNASICDTVVSPVCILSQYRIPKGQLASPGNELGIFQDLDQHYSPSDLDLYWANVYPDIPEGTYPIEKNIDGAMGAALQSQYVGIEANLDLEAAWPLIWPQKVVNFQTDDQYYETGYNFAGFFNTFYDAIDGSYCTYSAYGETGDCKVPECQDPPYPNPYGYNKPEMCGVYNATKVISISYGGGEGDLPPYYLQRRCSEIMKLGMQGITVVMASGDNGVASAPGDPSPNGCAGPDSNIFYPITDASCPYVLAVGGTVLETYDNPDAPHCRWNEVATKRFPSGGGFSNIYPRADYQADAVQAYFDGVDLPFPGYTDFTGFENITSGVYHINGRGYPDVSAVGDNYVITWLGGAGLVGGTSLAAPLWAGIITRINEERLAVGKSTVGFINPTLYANPQVLNDVTSGSNPGCGTDGFPVTTGWDPVTGLGTPNYPALLRLFLSLP
ncbi:putative Tripeptidyl-peptidase sed1 [Thozetella sp. PMI_491]|nr:putative Tripeptidyl-peptidase sed1 [Thozetella sp. PMI_491]